MSRNKFNNDIYNMYEEECLKNKDLTKELEYTKLENKNLKYELKYQKDSFEQKIKTEIEKASSSLISENTMLKDKLNDAYNEISRLKSQISSNNIKDYQIDKLINQVNKNSTNSGIPTSKQIRKNKTYLTGPNTYNHRERKFKSTGGQIGHKGETLTKEKLETKIKENRIPTKKSSIT